jgi:hypothetical protein
VALIKNRGKCHNPQNNPIIKLEARALNFFWRGSKTKPGHPNSSANTPIFKKMIENNRLERKSGLKPIPLPPNKIYNPPAIKCGVSVTIIIATYH